MQALAYPPELLAVFEAYATSLEPSSEPEYEMLHPFVQVPNGYLPIEIIQFHRGQRPNGETRLYHWAIFVPTSTRRGVGNYYEVAGGLRHGYITQQIVHDRHGKWDEERGSHLVGYVAPDSLGLLETHLSLVPAQQGRTDWNCQTWVVEALEGLTHEKAYAVQMEHEQWTRQMQIMDEAWNVGDA